MVKRKRKPDHAEKYIKTVRAVGEIEKHHEKSKSTTKTDIVRFLRILKLLRYLRRAKLRYGSAATVVILLSEQKLWRSVRYAIIHRVTLKSMQRTINVDR